MTAVFFLLLAAFAAGFVDAAVGGGGLIALPALVLGLPAGTPFTTLLGTNKVMSCTGTTVAVTQFVRAGLLRWREVVGPVLASAAGAALGVGLAYFLEGRADAFLRPLVVVLLTLMLVFTIAQPHLGRHHAPRFPPARERRLAAAIALALGFYDGFFGPGTGTVLIFLFVTVLGFDFLRASALAKAVNGASNLTSVALFVSRGSWLPVLALGLAAANALGGFVGARTAIARGSGWVRIVFLVVVTALLVRLGAQTWIR
jgi:uncharacterized membrane protein YfcA